MQLDWLKFLCVSPKTSKSKMAANYGLKNSFSVLGKRQETQIVKFNSYPTHLVCNVHLISNLLSFYMSLVVVMNCGAGNALYGIEISLF